MRAVCPICWREYSTKSMRKIYYPNLKGFVCRNCFREILLHRLAGERG